MTSSAGVDDVTATVGEGVWRRGPWLAQLSSQHAAVLCCRVDARAAKYTHLPASHSEDLQVGAELAGSPEASQAALSWGRLIWLELSCWP